MKQTTIKDLKKGELFTLKPIEEPDENMVYIRDEYDRESKTYCVYKWADVNRYSFKKGTTKVYTEFYF